MKLKTYGLVEEYGRTRDLRGPNSWLEDDLHMCELSNFNSSWFLLEIFIPIGFLYSLIQHCFDKACCKEAAKFASWYAEPGHRQDNRLHISAMCFSGDQIL